MRLKSPAPPSGLAPYDQTAGSIEELQRHLADLSRQARQAGPPLLSEAIAELTMMVEALQVAGEELRVQNEQLIESADAVARERQRYQDLFESAPDAYFVTDREGVIREANHAAATLLGATARVLVGKPLAVFVPRKEREAFRRRLPEVRHSGSTEEWELNLKPRYGSAVTAGVTIAAVNSPDGPGESLRWIVRNISRRRAEEAERYHLFVEGVQDYAVFMHDLDGVITTWNPAAEAILGYRAEDIIGQHSAIIFTPEDRAAGAPEQELRTAHDTGRAEDERWHVKGDGTRFWGSGVMTALRGTGGEVVAYAKVMRDLTSRHEEERTRAAESRKHRQMAEVFQQTVLEPVASDFLPGLEVAALYEPAWQESNVGGDFYDAYRLAGDRVALVVGDVTGKGLAAARRTAEVKFATRACLYHHREPGQVLYHMNNFLCRSHGNEGEAFVSLAVAIVDTATGEASVALAAAEPPFVLRADGRAETLRPGSVALGIFPDAPYEDQPFHLAPGDALMMITDGITEARSRAGRFLGDDGAVTLARQARALEALHAVGQAVLDGARAFAGGKLSDDACLLLARRR